MNGGLGLGEGVKAFGVKELYDSRQEHYMRQANT